MAIRTPLSMILASPLLSESPVGMVHPVLWTISSWLSAFLFPLSSPPDSQLLEQAKKSDCLILKFTGTGRSIDSGSKGREFRFRSCSSMAGCKALDFFNLMLKTIANSMKARFAVREKSTHLLYLLRSGNEGELGHLLDTTRRN